MTIDRPPEPRDVDRFYTRQRREILERIDASRGEDATSRAPRWRILLPAAAVLLLAVATLLLLPDAPVDRPSDVMLGDIGEPATDILAAFAPWTDENLELEADLMPGPGSVAWLMGDAELTVDEPAVPDFLEAFGEWQDSDNDNDGEA